METWFDPPDVSRYRERRRRGTRLPLLHSGIIDVRGYLAVGLGHGLTLLAGLHLVRRSAWPWRAGGTLLLALVLVSITSIVRYVRLPVDPDHKQESRRVF